MNTLILILLSLTFSFPAHAENIRIIRCKGSPVDLELEGHPTEDGVVWRVNSVDGGANKVADKKGDVVLSNYGLFLCSGAEVQYSKKSGKATFRYKYNSGAIGGGCMKSEGEARDCKEKEVSPEEYAESL